MKFAGLSAVAMEPLRATGFAVMTSAAAKDNFETPKNGVAWLPEEQRCVRAGLGLGLGLGPWIAVA